RLFCGPAEAEAYRQKVEVLAAALAGRQGLGGQGPLVAAPPGASNLVVHRYPVDGELPCLVAATDTRGMVPVFAEALDRAGLDVRRVEVSLGAYGRRHRCVLRYNVDVSSRSTGRRGRAVVFGKVYSGDAGEVVARVVPAITRHLVDSTTSRISVPSHLTYVPELHLSLLNRVPGRPVVADVIKATCLGRPLDSDWPTAAAAMDDAARAAAELHGWPHSDAPVRTLGHDVADLRADLRHLRKYSPRLAAHLGAHLDQIETAGIVTTTHPLALAHGDFSLAQLLHDGRRVSIIDFDSACRAEPAMDLGHFLAYLRLAIARYQATPKAGNELYQRLAWRYLDSYPSSMDDRVAVYRALSLLRITVHAWQKLKPARTQVALALLDDEMEKL
ncbi:MAG: phosphotransferase family protein, partial [Acidimicrobiales bacterium]